MARPQKEGLDYFPFNVDFFNDDKLQLIEAEFGERGLLIAIKLLCKVYKNGYYYQWGEDECLLFSKNAGAAFVPGLVTEVVNGLIRRSFFDKGVFDRFKILTSNGIQTRYLDAAKRRVSVTLIGEYIVNVNINKDNVYSNLIIEYINPQSKEKKSKEDKGMAQAPTYPPDIIEKFKAFEGWILKNATRVSKLKEPFTIEQYLKLQTDFPGQSKMMQAVLMDMHNKGDLLKKYTSANHTLRSWIRMRTDNTFTAKKEIQTIGSAPVKLLN